jgi:hypothetical protein
MKSFTIPFLALALSLGFAAVQAAETHPTPAQVTAAKEAYQGKTQALAPHTPSYAECKAGIVDKSITAAQNRAAARDAAKEACAAKCTTLRHRCMTRTGALRHKQRALDAACAKAPQSK